MSVFHGSLDTSGPAASALSPGAGESMILRLLRSRVNVVAQSPPGFQNEMFWGLLPQLQVLRAGATGVGLKPFAFKEKLWGLRSHPAVVGYGCPVGVGWAVCGEIVPQTFLPASVWACFQGIWRSYSDKLLGFFQRKFHIQTQIWFVCGVK